MTNRTAARDHRARDHKGARDQPRHINSQDDLPHDLAAEQAVLGAMLLSNDVAGEILTLLGADDFYNVNHATIFKAVAELHGRGEPTDPIAVAGHLSDAGDLGRIGGAPYLHTLIEAVPTTFNATWYARERIAPFAALRRIVATAARVSNAARMSDPARVGELIEWARGSIDQAAAAILDASPETADTWQPVDLTPALTGGVITTPPCLMARADGEFLLYPGRVHSLSGEPEAGKTWAALVAVLQALEDGQHVLYIDFEDTPEGITGRLLAMGARPEHIQERLHYIRPDRPIDSIARRDLAAVIEHNWTTIAVIDGVTEAMTLHGLDPYNNPDAAKFYEALPRFITRQSNPPSVLMIDHVPKDEDRPKRYAIGAQHKLAGLDGAAYVVDIVKSFAPGQPGMSKIRVAKDRPGQVRKNAVGGVIAEMHVSGHGEVVTVELKVPDDSKRAAGPASTFRPTIVMERVSRFVEVTPGASRNVIETAMRGKRDNVRMAIDILVAEGYLRVETGLRNSEHHFHVKPFRNDPDDADD